MDKKLSGAGESFQPQNRIVAAFHGYNSLPQECRYSWYWNRKVIENCSPSRKDGINLEKESQLRTLYCSFIQDIGMKLGVPQISIATAIMFCHRFYLHQSHAKNEWQTIATVCMFLASKVEDTPCHLNKVVKIAYETMYQRDYVAAQRINKKEVFEKQKSLILLGERLVLCTIRYDFDVRHPYKPLIEAVRKLQIDKKNVRQTAWNFVNDWLRTTLCLQYEPNYIAAGSLYLSAKHHNEKLPSGDNGCAWWQVLNVVPYKLDAVLKQMKELLCSKQKQVTPLPPKQLKKTETPVVAEAKVETVLSPDSCVSIDHVTPVPESTTSNAKSSTKDHCETGNSEGLNGTVKNCMEDVASIPESTTSNAKLCRKDQCETENSDGLNGTAKNCMEDVSSIPKSATSNAKLGTRNQRETGNCESLNGTVKNCMEYVSSIPESTTYNAKLGRKDQCETGTSEGLNGTVKNCMEDVSSIPESTTYNAKLGRKDQCETGNSEGLNGTVKNRMDDVPSIPESTTYNAKLSLKDQCETGNSEGLNGTVKNCMEDVPSIPEPASYNAKLSRKDQCETGNSEGLNGTIKNCMEDVSSVPESTTSTSKVNTENQCDTMDSNRVDGTVKSGLEDEVQNALKNLLDTNRIKSLMKNRKRKRNVSEQAISLESPHDDDWIEKELERGIVLTKRPKPCEDLVSF